MNYIWISISINLLISVFWVAFNSDGLFCSYLKHFLNLPIVGENIKIYLDFDRREGRGCFFSSYYVFQGFLALTVPVFLSFAYLILNKKRFPINIIAIIVSLFTAILIFYMSFLVTYNLSIKTDLINLEITYGWYSVFHFFLTYTAFSTVLFAFVLNVFGAISHEDNING
ncbi:hypothetical protein WNZ15_26190 [Roseibium sp. AS2]|uniref:hypothetical protein n=1 Tax=Roseibium sp. AS2 TaxID=3135781 RepID=UPI00316CE739